LGQRVWIDVQRLLVLVGVEEGSSIERNPASGKLRFEAGFERVNLLRLGDVHLFWEEEGLSIEGARTEAAAVAAV